MVEDEGKENSRNEEIEDLETVVLFVESASEFDEHQIDGEVGHQYEGHLHDGVVGGNVVEEEVQVTHRKDHSKHKLCFPRQT